MKSSRPPDEMFAARNCSENEGSDWPLMRLCYCANVNPLKSEINHYPKETSVSFVPMDAVGEYGELRLDQTKTLEEVASGYTYFRDGDVVVAKITPCFENGKGAIAKGLENGIGFGTTELHVLRPTAVDGRYLFYITISDAFRKIGASCMYGAGGQKRISEDFVRDFRHPIPNNATQVQIADFLDRETARIDSLIEMKQRQIELLQEKRAALISHAVIKGIDPNVEMKDSGVEWLGKIPAHWLTKRFKFILREPLQYGANEAAELDDPEFPRYVRITDVHDDGTLREDTFKSIPEEVARPYLLAEGDLLFARSGATVGKTFLYQESWGRAAYAGYLIRARIASPKMLPKFAAYFARSCSYWDWLRSSVIQATIQNVSADKYNNLVITIPALEEQTAIVHFLDREGAKIDGLIAHISRSIERLREYRSAIVTAAVTGQIDLREEVA